MRNFVPKLNKFEFGLWITSICVCILCFLICDTVNILSFVASIVGVTSLIFIAKGYISGQILVIIFATLYGIVSFEQRYYGEMITYVFMTLPIAVFTAIEWIKHPYKNTSVVEIGKVSKRHVFVIFLLCVGITFIMFFVLRYFNTANLLLSTLSISTSFIAASFGYLRSQYYAVGYAINDLVLIVLWILASIKDTSYLSMVLCFVMFFINDMYGYFSWTKMIKEQNQ